MATTENKILLETCWSSNKEAKWKKKQQMQYVDLNVNKDVSWNFSRILARTNHKNSEYNARWGWRF